MPKVNPRETTIFSKTVPKASKSSSQQSNKGRVLRDETKKPKKLSLQEQMIAEAQTAQLNQQSQPSTQSNSLVVDIHNIIPNKIEQNEVNNLFEIENNENNNTEMKKVSLIHELD